MANNTTKLLLGIVDPHIEIKTGARKNDGVIRFEGVLDYKPLACPKCGIINQAQIIKYGWRMTTVRFAKTLGNAVILKLKRRYFCCKACQSHFLAQTNLVPKHCSISNPTRQAGLEKLAEPVALKHIANELATSDTFVGRQLLCAERDFKPNFHWLPEVILMDEIKSTKTATAAMSFEFMDAKTHQLIDVLPFRTIHRLEKHFKRYAQTAREKVKIIVTDMNYTYPKLTKTIFPNAIVVIDKFHLTNALNRAFNQTRVRIMKKFTPGSREFKALKRYWKLLLVPREQLDYEHFRKWTYFPYWVTAKDIVTRLLKLDPILEQTYTVLNSVQTALKHKDWPNYNAVFWHTANTAGCSAEMLGALKILQTHHDEIHNTFMMPYSNGPLEGSNNKIKAIKRASFGFRSFFKFRIRVLYIFRVQTKKALITK